MTVCVSVVSDIIEAYFKNKGGNKSHWGAKLLLNQMKRRKPDSLLLKDSVRVSVGGQGKEWQETGCQQACIPI